MIGPDYMGEDYMRYRDLRGVLASSAAICAVAIATPVMAQTKSFDVPAQSAATGIPALAEQADVQILVSEDAVRGKSIRAIKGSMTVDQAVRRAAADAGLRVVSSDGRTWTLALAIAAAADPAPDSTYSANEIVVTAQKRAQSVQDVPLAVTALSGDQLQAQKVEGGFDLLRAVPNVTFSKSNFTGYNFSIRGVGTKAVSPTTDPGVAVEFNGTPLIRNRLFEQEYFDIERVEVLRGPQGTLHGRNATSGVINVISNKPDLNDFDAMVKLEAGNYRAQRAVGMINVPIVSDVLALRAAGSMTKRDGFGLNLYDNSDADDRNLWSSRVTLGFEPSSHIRADLVWEHFEENDRRQRTSKQLCTHDAGPTHIGNTEIVEAGAIAGSLALLRGTFSQGCLPGSLYDDAAYGVPNGFSIPFIAALAHPNGGLIGFSTNSNTTQKPVGAILTGVDPYGGADVRQSKDLRSFYSQIPTTYRANTDVFELNVSVDVTDALTFTSQSAYVTDDYYASQDYNRFTTVDPVFADTSKLWGFGNNNSDLTSRDLLANGVFCDPQVGCASSIVGQDVSRANSKQWSQEFLLRSDFDGPLNFSFGANYLKYKTVEDYFLFHNGITLASVVSINRAALGGSTDLNRSTTNPDCSYIGGSAALFGQFLCVPIDQRSIAEITDGRSLDDAGHNFFVSRNPYKLASHSAFGELYWKPTENLGLTVGLRYTDDKKTFRVIPSQTALTPRDFIGLQNLPPFLPEPTRNALGASNFIGTGFGYPEDTPVVTGWKKMSGRFSFDWKPDISFTDDTLIYGSFSRGYKAGGMNPPPIGFVYEEAEALGYFFPYSKVDIFKPEFVNAFEIGTKNILMGGDVTP